MDQPAAVDQVTTRGSVDLKVDGDVAQLVLRRSDKRNALTADMIDQLYDRVRALENDPAVRVVLLRGSGESAFCSGADTHEFGHVAPEDIRGAWTRQGQRAFAALADLPQTTVAVLTGSAYGGGFELALHCDFRVSLPHISVSLPEATLGTTPGWSGLARVVGLAGVPAARMLALTGRALSAPRAYEMGLIDMVDENVERAVEQLVSDILATGHVAQSVLKRLLARTGAATDSSPLIDSLAGAYCAAVGETTSLLGRTTRKGAP